MTEIPREEYEAKVGQEIGVSNWIDITQDRINRFAECTGDDQFIHVDPERARLTAFGSTIAHGFLTLSLLPQMLRDIPRLSGVAMNINYGLEHVRFVSPVLVGSRVRGRFSLAGFEQRGPREVQTVTEVTVQIDGRDKPAMVATWLHRRHLSGDI
jgi:acyl dehydratase